MAKRRAGSAPLFTIGYEQSTARRLLESLKQARVELVVDTRAVAASRRPGFSKRQLAAALDEQGVGYIHLQALGTPKEGRLAARAGKADVMLRIYERHLSTSRTQEQLDELVSLARSGRRLCLLCYERDPTLCHRQRIAQLVSKRLRIGVEHLFCAPV